MRTEDLLKAAASVAAFLFCLAPHEAFAKIPAKTPKPAETRKTGGEAANGDAQLENFQNLILKAQNLTLQQDRLQASQVLLRGLQRETRGSNAYKELTRALDELTSIFYTAKAQSLFSTAESAALDKPRDAMESLQEALKIEDKNITILKVLARLHLRMDECEKADANVKQAEDMNPYSGEVKLLRLQILACQKSYEALSAKLAERDPELESVSAFLGGLDVAEALRHKDFKKARTLVSAWSAQAPADPEAYYWQWEISRQLGATDRTAAAKYSQLCQNLTPRKRKSFSLNVDLCKGKVAVEAFLKETEAQPTPSAKEDSRP